MSALSSAPRPLIVCGPSGVGKGTLVTRLLNDEPTKFSHSVSHTTRAPRQGETHGKHYYFVSRADFEALRAQGGFYEWNEYNGNLYGTSKAEVARLQALGKSVLFDVDVNGASHLKDAALNPTPRFLFLSPPGADPLAVLRARLQGRGSENDASLERRLAQAAVELQWRDKAGFWDSVLVNDDVDKAFAEFKQFALNCH